MHKELAAHGYIGKHLNTLSDYLDRFLQFETSDAMNRESTWKKQLNVSVPERGVGIENVLSEIGNQIISNGSQIPKPGCTSYICTGATSVGVLASLSSSVASPQRIGLTAFNYLEEVSLNWMAQMFELPNDMKGLYSSGGSTANLVALGAARQKAFESIGLDPARDGVSKPCRIYASQYTHHTIQRSAAVLGMGRNCVKLIPVDCNGRLIPEELAKQIKKDAKDDCLPVAIVANAGSTSLGAIDPLQAIGKIAHKNNIWFHVDGAYGLPGVLDPAIKHLYTGLSLADSIIVDPHKWLGAPIGIGATYVREYALLQRAFTQEESNYLEGSLSKTTHTNSMDSLGIPYNDFGVELSAPPRGVVVWALIKEIGIAGMRARICRHNAMAKYIADKAKSHSNLELMLEPTLSICCFRYVTDELTDLNQLNRQIHRQLVRNGTNIPSTTMIDGKLVIRPCFIGARTGWAQATDLINEVLKIGRQMSNSNLQLSQSK
ncbi:MAG: pyridoxal phosphate-dependent decarboxylase family protein [Kangiellaceae bacterium]